MKLSSGEKIIGKYLVANSLDGRHKLYTDNPREAVWTANRIPGSVITNLQGEREFYRDEQGRWRSRIV